jgi:hypothetical protein
VASVIQLRQPAPKAAPAKAKPRKRAKVGSTTYRNELLALLHAQSRRALADDWSDSNALRALAAAARSVGPKAKRLIFAGIEFKLERGWFTHVLCPRSGRNLVSVW